MLFPAKEILTKDGRSAFIRNAMIEDADELICFLKTTASQTPYLIREPEEVTLTHVQEEDFLGRMMESERELLLVAQIDGKHVGNCSLSQVGAYQRYSHRCEVAIALYQEYWGLGLGRQMMQALLDTAAGCGYEQAELEVNAENEKAIALYEKLGFRIYGTRKHDMKYRDGRYADAYLMVKYFQERYFFSITVV